ncbi:hypothetical protein LZ32DRAFT_417751 [Colletotrichum eremochloae]|nr:hypothetical protein LZ32DRAFT_417751 [Colletotrichum eremochloae]
MRAKTKPCEPEMFCKVTWANRIILEVLANPRSTIRQATEQNTVRHPRAKRDRTTKTRSQSKKSTRKLRPNGSSLKLSKQALNSRLPTVHHDRKDQRSMTENGNKKTRAVQHSLISHRSAFSIQHLASSIGRISMTRGGSKESQTVNSCCGRRRFTVLDGCGGSRESDWDPFCTESTF